MKKFLIVILSCFFLAGCVSTDSKRDYVVVYNDCPWVLDVYISHWGIPLMWKNIGKEGQILYISPDSKIALKIKGVYDIDSTRKTVRIEPWTSKVVISWSSYYDDYIVSTR